MPIKPPTNADSITGRSVTLQDVARHLGVTTATVSRAINGGSVAPSVRETVLKAVEEMGYRPNLTARSMRTGKTGQIGLLLRANRWRSPQARHSSLSFEMLQGVSDELEEAGYIVNLIRVTDLERESSLQSKILQGRFLDGVIVIGDICSANSAHIEEMSTHCIWADSSIWHEQNCVRRDEFYAAQLVAREIAARGYREWIVLDRFYDPSVDFREGQHFSFQVRNEGIQKVADEVGATISRFLYDGYTRDFSALWPQLSPRVAVISPTSSDLHNLVYAASLSPFRIGYDFALACCDDAFHGSFNIGRIAHTPFSRFEMGQMAARLMLHCLQKGTPAPSILLRSEWVEGESVPPCP